MTRKEKTKKCIKLKRKRRGKGTLKEEEKGR